MASPTRCTQANCPAGDVVGPQPGSIHQDSPDDPLVRCLSQAQYNMGSGVILQIQDAMKAHAKVVFDGKLGEPGRLEIHPDLSRPGPNQSWKDVTRNSYSHLGQVGGILKDHPDRDSYLANPAKMRQVEEAEKKYRGDEGEEKSLLAALYAMEGKEGAIMHGHKSSLSLVEHRLEQASNLSPEEKLKLEYGFIGKVPEEGNIKTEIEALVTDYFGALGPLSIADFNSAIGSVEARQTGNRFEKRKRKENLEILKKFKDEDQNGPTPSTHIDPFKPLFQTKMKKQLNQLKREHDLNIVRPNFKTSIQSEVKAVSSNVGGVNNVVKGALEQLRRGKEEMKRVHGHLLDPEWRFFGLVMLPNLSRQDRDLICTQINICTRCKNFILVDDVQSELMDVFSSHFTAEYPDEATWRAQYKELVTRLASLAFMIPSFSSSNITGTNDSIIGGFTDKDIFEVLGSNIAVELWKNIAHRGSPLKIIFLNRLQAVVWNERRMVLLADFSVGKTTLMMNKAVSLALGGETVTIFCLEDETFGTRDLEKILGIWNKRRFATISANIKTLSLLDLKQFCREHGGYRECNRSSSTWRMSRTWRLSGMQQVLFYLENVQDIPNHLIIDEACFEKQQDNEDAVDETATVQVLKKVSEKMPSPSSQIWIAYFSQRLVDGSDTYPAANYQCLADEFAASGFAVPPLHHNMRNSHEVARAAAARMPTFGGMDFAIHPPMAPAALTPPTKPLWIKCQSRSEYVAAAVEAYRHIQATASPAASPSPVVILCNEGELYEAQVNAVKSAVEGEGVAVTRYWTPADRPQLEQFLDAPQGVLITETGAFSGMESTKTIIIGDVRDRGELLRAVEKLVLVTTDEPDEDEKVAFEVKNYPYNS